MTTPKKEFSGGNVDYYLLNIAEPKRLPPYMVECEDIIEALNMTFAEGNVLKSLWRSCNMRVHGHGKRGQDDFGVYDGDKVAYYGARVQVQRIRLRVAHEKALLPVVAPILDPGLNIPSVGALLRTGVKEQRAVFPKLNPDVFKGDKA